MASVCTKCGAEVADGAYACTACGAPVMAAPSVATTTQPVAAVPPPVAAAAAAPPPQQGSNAVKIILIVVAILVGLGILGAGAFGFMVWRVAHAIHVSGSGNNGAVSVSTPGGTFSTNSSDTYSADELGTDIYPGATAGKGGMRMDLPTGKVVTAVYVTSDTKDQVTAFYKSKFGSEGSTFDAPTGTVMSVNKSPEDAVMVTITNNSSENQGKTQITIVHTITKKGS